MKLSVLATALGALILLGCSSQNQAISVTHPTVPTVQANAVSTSSTLAATGRDPAQFPAYVEQLKQQASLQGITQATLDKSFAQVHFIDRVINSDRNQLEKKITLDDYLARVLSAGKIKQGQTLYQHYQPQLTNISKHYGVPPQYIVALWGMESGFGKLQGKEDVISALATLAFEGRREAFFTKELIAALNIIQRGDVTVEQLQGSWAGAMGQSQFMPTSFLTYGADGDGDGKIDIWHNVDDVFASTANYLATEGWQAHQGWGQEVRLPAGFAAAHAGLQNAQAKTVAQWSQMGIRLLNGGVLTPNSQRAWIITPDDNQGRTFLVFDNFRTIMHWNRSYYFAISIGMMADSIVKSSETVARQSATKQPTTKHSAVKPLAVK